MGAVAREVCLAAGGDVAIDHDGAKRISEVLRDLVAPEAAYSVSQGVVRFLRFRRASQTTDEFPVRLDLLRRTERPKMQMGGALPEITRLGKSPVAASAQGNLGVSSVSRQMRRSSGPGGGVARRDVLSAADVDKSSGEDGDFAA